jgi:hypothetical protein
MNFRLKTFQKISYELIFFLLRKINNFYLKKKEINFKDFRISTHDLIT